MPADLSAVLGRLREKFDRINKSELVHAWMLVPGDYGCLLAVAEAAALVREQAEDDGDGISPHAWHAFYDALDALAASLPEEGEG